MHRLAVIMLALPSACLAALAEPLRLEEVLRSTRESYPLLLSAIQDRARAQGKTLAAQGAFDTKLGVKSDSNQFGFYKNRTHGAQVAQPLGSLGGEVFGGYKRGQGNYGPWEQDLLSLSGGQWNAGVRLPLFRNRETDERRTDLLIARLSVELADASIEKRRLKVLEEASKSYWQWVGAGQKLSIAEDLLSLAEDRVSQVQEASDAGQIAAIEITDNRRAVLQRRSAVVSANRELQNASYEMSLFYRDSGGRPVVAAREQLPDFPAPSAITEGQFELDRARALEERPEISAARVELRQADAARRLARNQLQPEVEVTAQYRRDVGTGSITKRGDEFVAGIALKTPFQRRKAKGEAAIQEAKIAQLNQKLRFARNRVEVEVLDARSAVDAALERLSLARGEYDAAQQLAEAERERFTLGASTLFVVNLRELGAASARLKVVSSLADSHKALAVYRAATVDLQ